MLPYWKYFSQFLRISEADLEVLSELFLQVKNTVMTSQLKLEHDPAGPVKNYSNFIE